MIDIWIEKYRPKSLDEISGQAEIVEKLKAFVRAREIPHLIFAGPAGTGKTSAALALAAELFGEDWKMSFLELNASNERGIDVIREQVKDFARIRPSNSLGFKIIFMDEADQLTSEAQAALRRTMEMYSETTRFIFSCNYSSQIIPPIQSRTVVLRFRPLSKEDVVKRLKYIAEQEKVDLSDDSAEAIYEASEGDMRKALNIFQAVASSGNTSPSRIFEMVGKTSRKEYEKLLRISLEGLFEDARNELDRMLIQQGMSGIDIIRGLHSAVRSSQIEPRKKAEVIMALGEAEFRIVEGGSDNIQLDALIARLSYIGGRLS
ncbi:replication factor C small subunit [Thermogymnomonas acidicola]|nr:replication factor C small subunit [Thermogymnomonas acidicola]